MFKGVTYDESKTHDIVNERISSIYSHNDFSLSVLRLLCGHIIYSGVFMIPDYQLEQGKQYSIEDMCSTAKGLITYNLHDILYTLADIILCDSDIDSRLDTVLNDCLLLDCLRFLNLPVFDTVASLLLCHIQLKSGKVENNTYELVRSFSSVEPLLYQFTTKYL